MALPQNALISVYEKGGIEEFAGGLHELDVAIYASGGSADRIAKAGIPVTDVAELVGGEAILEHRVVTLSREIHAGLLADRRSDMHVRELERLGIPLLGLVCVDMYPLEKAIEDGLDELAVIEKTDVGGPTMLHSAAKGRRIVLSRQDQRVPVLDWLRAGQPDEENVLRTLAAVAEAETAQYIKHSAHYLGGLVLQDRQSSSFVEILSQPLELAS